MKKPRHPGQKWWHDYARLSHLGFQILAAVLLGIGGGYLIDSAFSSKYPVFTIIGGVLGIFAALLMVVRTYGNPKK